MDDARPPAHRVSEALYDQFGEGRKDKRRSSFTLPRSFSALRLKPEAESSNPAPQEDNQNFPKVSRESSVSRMDTDSKNSVKLRRKSSFKNMIDRFRRYKSTESLGVNRSQNRTPVQMAPNYTEEAPGRIVVPVMGLQNHGNSCYINAVVQCLNNTAQLYEFFISGKYRRELQKRNRDNSKKFGTNGELTKACGALIQSLGGSTYVPEVSNALITTVSKYWSQFNDGGEQDAQEFLIWLLDKIHEDLNKKRRKKLKVRKSHKPDDFLAATIEGAGGSSYISRLYHALFRSSLTCRECGQQSNTFDPFTCLSVPLPQIDIRALFVSVVFADSPSKNIVRYGFSTSLDSSVKDVKEIVSKKVHIRLEDLLLLEVSEEGFQKTLSDESETDVLQELGDLFAVELPKDALSNSEIELHVVLLHVINDEKKITRISGPKILQVAREINHAELEDKILANLDIAPGTKLPLFKIHLVERNAYLDEKLEHPLYADPVEECLSFCTASGPKHLKLYVEWKPEDAEHVQKNIIAEKLFDHESVEGTLSIPEVAKKTTLTECMDLFMQEEKVGLDEQWECPNCGALQVGITKRGTLWTLPEILVIHLKRFRQSATSRFKLTTMVDFPLEHLNMARYMTQDKDLDWKSRGKNGHSYKSSWFPWTSKPRKAPDFQMNQTTSYSLFGVVNHHGRLNSGHYTSYCRHPADGAWYLYDDTRVKTVDNRAEIVTKDAYILFYQREPLNVYPSLYYNDFGTTSHSMFELRTPTPRPTRSTEDLTSNNNEYQADSSFSRSAHIYASLPRLPKASSVNVHRPDRLTTTSSASTIVTNGQDKQKEYVYERAATVPSVDAASSSPLVSSSGDIVPNGAKHPDDTAYNKALSSQPQLVGYRQRSVQESCV